MKSIKLPLVHIAIAFLIASTTTSCGNPMSFDEEYDLSIRAGRGELSEKERAALQEKNHPILMQMGDPNTRILIENFANLSNTLHNELRDKGYLKWKYAELDIQHQKPFLSLVEVNLAIAKQQGAQVSPGFSVEALKRAEVGYAVININSKNNLKVVSLFILWPEISAPTWVTVVNAKLAGTQEYFQAHLKRLPILRPLNLSSLP